MCLILPLFIFNIWITFVTGMQQFCQESADCSIRVGTTCQNSECICPQAPDSPFPRPCPPALGFGEKCTSDVDCGNELVCDKLDNRSCRCRRGRVWDPVSKRCYVIDEENSYVTKRYDLTRDVIIPSVILATLATTASLCYRLFCKRKSWRRRRRGADVARALEEAQLPYVGTSQPATWIASYRGSIPSIGPFISVFGTVERSGPPCLLLPVGPPPYEEALKHKVILSSYQPPPAALVETTPL